MRLFTLAHKFMYIYSYHFRKMLVYYGNDIKKQFSPTLVIIKSFAITAYTKRLTRKTSTQNVVMRNIFYDNFCYVAIWNDTKIFLITGLSIIIYIRCKHATCTKGA